MNMENPFLLQAENFNISQISSLEKQRNFVALIQVRIIILFDR